jgi:IclR family pca regulon transcriptional regulator
LRNSELADAIGLSRSTTHRYATTLVELGYLEQDRERRYCLAHDAARSGTTIVDTVRRETPARVILEELRNKTGHTVSMGLLDGARVLYVHRLHGHRAGQYEADGDIRAGAHAPAHSTAVGRALLSSLLDSEFRSLLADMRSDDGTELDPAKQASLVREVEQARRDGIAFSGEHNTSPTRSIAAPIARWLDKPILAVELTVPASAYTTDGLLAHFAEPVGQTARFLST